MGSAVPAGETTILELCKTYSTNHTHKTLINYNISACHSPQAKEWVVSDIISLNQLGQQKRIPEHMQLTLGISTFACHYMYVTDVMQQTL